jgi:hypothetical protein
MIRASKGPTLLMWISESEISSYPQKPIAPVSPLILTKGSSSKPIFSPMQTMIMSLLKVLSKFINCSFIDELMHSNEPFNFETAKQKIIEELQNQSMSQCTIFNMTNTTSGQPIRYRRKMPDFLFNKGKHQKYESCLADESTNQRSDIIYANYRSETQKDIKQALLDKVSKTKVLKQKSFN